MLRYFFERSDEDRSGLFDGLAIRDEECFGAHQGKYPVIWLTLKDVKHREWSGCLAMLQAVISEAYSNHRHLLESDALFPEEKAYVRNVIEEKFRQTDDERSLKNLSMYLRRHAGRHPD